MAYDVLIRRNSDGEIRRRTLTDLEWIDADIYWWTDGSFGCDCNRFLEFERAAGGDPELETAVCGNSAYTVLKVILPDGSEVKIDEIAVAGLDETV